MIQTASYTDIGGRVKNEDCVRMTRRENELCLVVADGLGGHGGGADASCAAAELICSGWDGTVSEDALADLVRAAHVRVRGMQTAVCSMKTTVTLLAISGMKAAWAHVGDSRIYHFLDGELVHQTRDHSASQIAVMLGNITEAEIRFHEDRNRVYRALGQDGELKVDTHFEPLRPGRHAFLLCTDGFWEYVLEREMEKDLAASYGPEDWIEHMRSRLSARVPAGNDNNSAAAVWVDMV